MPAGILPFKREHAFTNVSPRYLDIHQKEKREYVPPEPTRYDTQRQWQGVGPRYLQGVSHHEQEQLKQQRETADKARAGDHKDPLGGWDQADSHRDYTKRHIGNVTPRYADHFLNQQQNGNNNNKNSDDDDDDDDDNGNHRLMGGGPIKKKKVEESLKLERGWRGTHALNRHTTFDVMYSKWLKKHADDPFMQRKKNSARSPVADWLKGEGPLAEKSQSHNASGRSGTPSDYTEIEASKRRAQSPWQRNRSPEKFMGPEWKSVSRRNDAFDTIRKQTLKTNPQYFQCEKHAHDVIEHQKAKKVQDGFIPKVATLSLAYQIQQHQHELSSSSSPSRYNTNNNNSSRSPSRGGYRSPSSQRGGAGVVASNNSSRRGSPARNNVVNSRNNNTQGQSMLNSSSNKNKKVTINNNSDQQQPKKSYQIGNNNNDNHEQEGDEDDDDDLAIPTMTKPAATNSPSPSSRRF